MFTLEQILNAPSVPYSSPQAYLWSSFGIGELDKYGVIRGLERFTARVVSFARYDSRRFSTLFIILENGEDILLGYGSGREGEDLEIWVPLRMPDWLEQHVHDSTPISEFLKNLAFHPHYSLDVGLGKYTDDPDLSSQWSDFSIAEMADYVCLPGV